MASLRVTTKTGLRLSSASAHKSRLGQGPLPQLPRLFFDQGAGSLLQAGQFIVSLGLASVALNDRTSCLLAPKAVHKAFESQSDRF